MLQFLLTNRLQARRRFRNVATVLGTSQLRLLTQPRHVVVGTRIVGLVRETREYRLIAEGIEDQLRWFGRAARSEIMLTNRKLPYHQDSSHHEYKLHR